MKFKFHLIEHKDVKNVLQTYSWFKQTRGGEIMKNKENYSAQEKDSEFHLSIPKGLVSRPRGGFFSGGGGHYTYQQFTQYCLNDQGGEPTESAFKAKFTAWSIEGSNGFFLYPEGTAFKVLARHFMEGDEPITYQADAAHYTALMLCLHPTVFPMGFSENDQLASYQITASWEPGGPSDFQLVSQKPIETTGEIFTWKHYYYDQKVRLKIKIFPSPLAGTIFFWVDVSVLFRRKAFDGSSFLIGGGHKGFN